MCDVAICAPVSRLQSNCVPAAVASRRQAIVCREMRMQLLSLLPGKDIVFGRREDFPLLLLLPVQSPTVTVFLLTLVCPELGVFLARHLAVSLVCRLSIFSSCSLFLLQNCC